MATVDDVNRMRQFCDTLYPDRVDSPGAIWLGKLVDAFGEAVDNGRFKAASGEYPGDVVSDIADSSVPVSSVHELWTVFVDLGAYQHDVIGDIETEPIRNSEDATNWAGDILCDIARQGLHGWLDSCSHSDLCKGDTCGQCGECIECEKCMCCRLCLNPSDECTCTTCMTCFEDVPGGVLHVCPGPAA